MILDDLGDRLTTQGVVQNNGDLALGLLPSTPDDVVALLLTAGSSPVRAMGAGPGNALVERPHVQCIARSLVPRTAYKLAQDVWFALDGLGNVTINGARYLHCVALQSPFEIGVDQARRYMYAVNFELTRVPATSS